MEARKLWTPDRRDMIWINCNPQAGREMKDIHPLLVLSPKEFNERTGIVLGLPMTTAAFSETNPFAVKFAGARRKETLKATLAGGFDILQDLSRRTFNDALGLLHR